MAAVVVETLQELVAVELVEVVMALMVELEIVELQTLVVVAVVQVILEVILELLIMADLVVQE